MGFVKNLLYIAFKDFSMLHYGANAKVLSQCRAFSQYGYQVDLIGRQGMDTVLMQNETVSKRLWTGHMAIKNTRIRNLAAKQRQIQAIRKYIRGKRYSACYIRYDFADPGFLRLLKDIRGVCPCIVLELPTYPYEGENQEGILSKAKLLIDGYAREKMHKYVQFIVTFYPGYERLFGIPVQVVPNGFDFSTMNPVKSPLPQDAIHLMAVSSMRQWHGYERFIEGLRIYYQEGEKNRRNLVLHLVGNGREYGKYKGLVERYGLQSHVILEGAMHGEKLDALYEKCAIGIDSLARHRSGIHVLSSLKSREYGAKGLPIINSCKIDIIEEDFPYFMEVPADESPIEISDVVNFYDRCFSGEKDRQQIGREILRYMEKKTGMKETLLPVAERMEAGAQRP